MKKSNSFFLITSLPSILTGAVLILVVFLLNTAFAQLNADNILMAPFVSEQNSQSIIQNSEKDIIFIENLGQIKDDRLKRGKKRQDILFLTRSQGVDMYITSSGISYVFRKIEGNMKNKTGDAMPKSEIRQVKTIYYRLDMELVGMNKDFKIKKELAVEQQFNYYTPEYPNGISSGAYKKVTIENVYDGIDLIYYEKEGKMKYDFQVKAGADAQKIKTKYKGARALYLNKDGSVIVTTPMGEIREEKPYTYSITTGLKIESRYKVNDNVVQFEVVEYNKSEEIIIDPYRIWATYYGGSNSDYGNSICTDNSGNLYVIGMTYSTNFPTQTLTGAYNQTTYGGGLGDAFILKFSSSGARLWAAYYGGNDNDWGESICTDNLGNLFVTGYTSSTNFPTQTLPGAYNQSYSGGYDAFILKFNSNGARLWATYYGGSGSGGSGYEGGNSICTDNSGNLYVTGWTNSTNFPIQTLTGGYNQTTYGGGDGDAFILKFNSNCARLWATYYGGIAYDEGLSICTDNLNNLYVTGWTSSTNFPTQILPGAYNQTTGIGSSVFILKFASTGSRQWAAYYGGSYGDGGRGICIDNSGNLYVTGGTSSTNFPTQILPGAYNQTTYSGSPGDAFILKFDSNCARLWATYYGGSSYDDGYEVCTDNSGNLYVIGETNSNNFPTQILSGAYNQTTRGGFYDIFILKFTNSGARQWATYYGGNDYDSEPGVCIDSSSNFYVTGSTKSINFPTKTLSGAYNDTALDGSADAFILKFSSTVDIKKISNEIPVKYSLHQNYPNPFNPTTNIRYDIPKSSFVKITVYNILGKELATLVNEKLSAGSYEVDWDATSYTSGVYFYKLITDNFVDVKKMLLIK